MTVTKKGISPKRKRLGNDHRRSSPVRSSRELLAKLATLEKTTRPAKGPQTALGKDRKAVEALNLASELVRAVAGWAIDHQMGLASRAQESLVEILPELSNLTIYKIAIAEVDNHQLEIEGAKEEGLTSPILVRQALMNLLQTNPGGFPKKLTRIALSALQALDYNEVHPVLQPNKGRRKIGISDLNMQLSILIWVEHYVGRGFKTHEALHRVAEAFGVAPPTLRSWKLRLRKELGALKLENWLENARVFDQDYEDAYDQEMISDAEKYRLFISRKA